MVDGRPHRKKIRYASFFLALDARDDSGKRWQDNPTIYKCQYLECWGWHTTTQTHSPFKLRLPELEAERILFGRTPR